MRYFGMRNVLLFLPLLVSFIGCSDSPEMECRLASGNFDGFSWRGDCQLGLASGVGQATYSQRGMLSATYTGGMLMGKPSGQGSMVFANGERLEGQFAGGALNGLGKIEFAQPVPVGNGMILAGYQGNFMNGVLNGRGVEIFRVNGGEYLREGTFQNGVLIPNPLANAPQQPSAMSFPNAGTYSPHSESAKLNYLYNSQMRDTYHEKSIDSTRELHQTLRSGAIRSGD